MDQVEHVPEGVLRLRRHNGEPQCKKGRARRDVVKLTKKGHQELETRIEQPRKVIIP